MDLSVIETWCENLHKGTDIETLRDIIHVCYKIEAKCRQEEQPPTFNSEITQSAVRLTEILMAFIKSDMLGIECQTLCFTSYCSLFVIFTEEYTEICLRNINTMLSCFMLQRNTEMENICTNTLIFMSNLESRKTEQRIATLISGLFQINFLNKFHLPESSRVRELSEEIIDNCFKITIKACLSYSCCTFVHFRNLHSIINKMMLWDCYERIIGDTQNILLLVIFNNWENVLSGIREINIKVWRLFLEIINKNNSKYPDLFNSITISILKFPWNKAKYFALCEIIHQLKCDILEFLINHPTCASGLEYSLKHTSLVSAGGDLYKVILEKFKSFDEWKDTFMTLFEDILGSNNNIPQNNLLNYWIPATVKKYPVLIDHLLDFFFQNDIMPRENTLPLMSILKLCRKSGFILSDWNSIQDEKHNLKNIIDIGLMHSNEDVRAQAFQILCVTKKNSVPCKEEFDKVKVFLQLNVNSDSAPFRQLNLNSITSFLIRIRDSFLIIIKKEKKKGSDENKTHLSHIEHFFVWLHSFLMQNLDCRRNYEFSGNYQRIIFSLQIFDVILRYFCGGYNDIENIQRSLCRKGNQRDQGWKIVDYLKGRKKWLFHNPHSFNTLLKCIRHSTNDVRNAATDIIIKYFSHNMSRRVKKNLFIDGMVMCNNRMFYEAECGALMFKIIGYLNRDPPVTTDPIQDIIYPFSIFEYLLKKTWKQFLYQEADLLLSIYNNEPLHGLISAINMYVLNSEMVIKKTTIESFEALLSAVTEHFIKVLACKFQSGENVDAPPSFAEMGESIESIIQNSQFKQTSVNSESKHFLSNAHQLVLNHIWLNLKVCCDFSSTIITMQSSILDEKDLRELLNIPISVLTKCRHKGAIESAGTALGRSIKHITSQHVPQWNSLISNLLREFLIQSTSENVQGVSVTRRSAGLTILVHRIVSNDSQEGKPLFYITMEVLLNVFTRPDIERPVEPLERDVDFNPNISMVISSIGGSANESDIPLARALHLLCRTVSESSLANHVIQFAPQLTTVCFNHLTNQQWQVRNAALQLYGALVPKLIGQKKGQSEDDFAKAPVSPDELFSHVPSLWNHIKTSLQEASAVDDSANILSSHSNIVSILSLLASMANRYSLNSFCLEESKCLGINMAIIEDIFPPLIILLGSPIYNIRNICANIIASYFDVSFVYDHWVTSNRMTLKENELHGYLLTLKQYSIYYTSFKKYSFKCEENEQINSILKTFLSNLNDIIITKNSSYITKALHLEIVQMFENENQDFPNSLDEKIQLVRKYGSNVKLQVGIDHWMQLNMSQALMNCPDDEIIVIVKKCVTDNYIMLGEAEFWTSLRNRIHELLRTSPQNLYYRDLFSYLVNLACENKFIIDKMVYEILYLISSKSRSVSSYGMIGKVYLNIEDTMEIYKSGYLIPLVCSMACDRDILNCNVGLHLELTKMCKTLSKPQYFEADDRKTSAISLVHLAKLLKFYKDKNSTDQINEIKVNILITALWLLQDEDSEVRMECSNMHLRHEDYQTSIHSNMQMKTILKLRYLLTLFNKSKENLIKFFTELLDELDSVKLLKEANDLKNPFDHNTNNIYWEPKLIEKRISKCLQELSETAK